MATIQSGSHGRCGGHVCVAALLRVHRGATMDRILLVDDDVEVRPLLERILLDNGYQVVTAEAVATATALLGSQPLDLAICNGNLPEGSGLTVADKAIAAGVKALVVTRRDSIGREGTRSRRRPS